MNNRHSTAKGPMLEKSKAFAVCVIKLTQELTTERHEYVLSRQVLRSATSIGANLREARGAQSQADFLSKQSVALKEAYETEYWIELLAETGYLSSDREELLMADIAELISMLTSSVKKLKTTMDINNPLYVCDTNDENYINSFTPPQDF